MSTLPSAEQLLPLAALECVERAQPAQPRIPWPATTIAAVAVGLAAFAPAGTHHSTTRAHESRPERPPARIEPRSTWPRLAPTPPARRAERPRTRRGHPHRRRAPSPVPTSTP